MLAPGEYLIRTPVPAPPPEVVPAPNSAPADEEDEPSMSFLMILLRALGAMHT